MRAVTLRITSQHENDLVPPRVGEERELSADEEDDSLDEVLGLVA